MLITTIFLTNQCGWNEGEQVPLLLPFNVVGQQDEDALADDPWNDEEVHGQLAAEHVAPGADVERKEDGEEGGDELLVDVELGNLEIKRSNSMSSGKSKITTLESY